MLGLYMFKGLWKNRFSCKHTWSHKVLNKVLLHAIDSHWIHHLCYSWRASITSLGFYLGRKFPDVHWPDINHSKLAFMFILGRALKSRSCVSIGWLFTRWNLPELLISLIASDIFQKVNSQRRVAVNSIRLSWKLLTTSTNDFIKSVIFWFCLPTT